MNIGLAVAALFSFATWGIHTFLGGPAVARPLLEAEMEPVAKYTNYYCWHIVTIVLFAMATGYGWAAIEPGALDVAFGLTALSGAFGAWNLALVAWSRRTPIELPQWTLFLAIGLAGAIGLWTAA